MKLFCPTKGCAHVIDRPDHKRGFLIVRCTNCGQTTNHVPMTDAEATARARALKTGGRRG